MSHNIAEWLAYMFVQQCDCAIIICFQAYIMFLQLYFLQFFRASIYVAIVMFLMLSISFFLFNVLWLTLLVGCYGRNKLMMTTMMMMVIIIY